MLLHYPTRTLTQGATIPSGETRKTPSSLPCRPAWVWSTCSGRAPRWTSVSFRFKKSKEISVYVLRLPINKINARNFGLLSPDAFLLEDLQEDD